jgi:cysteinyl-tRNA synthetase
MNITDIEDKIIKRALEENKTPKEITEYWEKDFFEICGMLKIDPPNVVTRVTEFVPEIVRFIEKIIENGFAYESNGSVYFNVDAYQKDDRFIYP